MDSLLLISSKSSPTPRHGGFGRAGYDQHLRWKDSEPESQRLRDRELKFEIWGLFNEKQNRSRGDAIGPPLEELRLACFFTPLPPLTSHLLKLRGIAWIVCEINLFVWINIEIK